MDLVSEKAKDMAAEVTEKAMDMAAEQQLNKNHQDQATKMIFCWMSLLDPYLSPYPLNY